MALDIGHAPVEGRERRIDALHHVAGAIYIMGRLPECTVCCNSLYSLAQLSMQNRQKFEPNKKLRMDSTPECCENYYSRCYSSISGRTVVD
jgi:hypothetical protein